MTNEQIIYNKSMELVEAGVLKTVNIGGVDMPEPIHTFNGWKERGYIVKKGEKSFIKFPIWKCGGKKQTVKLEDGSTEEKETATMFTKLSAFFTYAQVEPIATKPVA